jgi:Family of unknown function (DUF5317)
VSFLGLVVLVAALVPLVTGGSYRRLAEAPWRWGGLLALGLALQLLLDTGLIPRSSWHSVGFGILVASYVLLIGFCSGNVLVRGMAVVLVGVALNAFVVTIDQGMPVRIPPDWRHGHDRVSATVKHHPRVPGDHLLVLTDIIVLRRLDAVVSFGDLIIAFGLVDAAFWASRRPRRTRPRSPELDPIPTDRDPDAEPERLGAADREADVSISVGAGAHAHAPPNEPKPAPPEPTRQPVHSGAARGRAATRPSRSARRTRAGASPAAIQDALERLERP